MNTLDLLNQLNNTKSTNLLGADTLINAFVPDNIRVVNGNNGTFLLSIIQKGQCKLPIHSESNGTVFEFCADLPQQWRVLVMPPQVLTIGNVKNIKGFNIYEMDDGTVISLYFRDEWCISSARGIHMNNIMWSSSKSYMSVLLEVLSIYNILLDEVDKTVSHTIAFHHPDFHPFGKRIYAWNISSASGVNCVDSTLALPEQRLAKFAVNSESSPDILNIINRNNTDAMRSYLNHNRIHYGYILRGNGVSYVMESSLFRIIREVSYRAPNTGASYATNELITKQILVPEKRVLYNALRAYLTESLKYDAQRLFANYGELYSKFELMFNDFATIILLALYSNNEMTCIPSNEVNVPASYKTIDNIFKVVANHIKNIGGIDLQSKDSKGIVMDFLKDKKFIHAYVDYL
jgi:hypothetical protein